MNFKFGEVVKRAWQIIWKHKVLWIFGILASCSRSSGSFNSSSRWSSNNGTTPNLPPQVMQWFQWIQNHLVPFIAITVAVFCVIWIVSIFLSTIGKIGLIRGVAQAEGGAEKLIFGQLFSESMPYFWRMFGLSLILAIPLLIVFVILFAGLIAFAISASGGNHNSAVGLVAMVLILIGCVCLLIPVMFVLGMIFNQEERAILLDELGVMPGVSRGWDILLANLGAI